MIFFADVYLVLVSFMCMWILSFSSKIRAWMIYGVHHTTYMQLVFHSPTCVSGKQVMCRSTAHLHRQANNRRSLQLVAEVSRISWTFVRSYGAHLRGLCLHPHICGELSALFLGVTFRGFGNQLCDLLMLQPSLALGVKSHYTYDIIGYIAHNRAHNRAHA